MVAMICNNHFISASDGLRFSYHNIYFAKLSADIIEGIREGSTRLLKWAEPVK